YAGLAGYAGYQAQPALRNSPRLRSLDVPIVIASLANIAWLLLWHYQYYVSSLMVMLVLLGSLVTIYRRLDPERATAPLARRWAVHHVFSVYLGWITIATLANLGVVLEYVGWAGAAAVPEIGWFTMGLVLVLAVAGVVAWTRADVVYLLTLAWGLVGIGVERADDPRIATLAWTATAVLAVFVALSAVRPDPPVPRGG
ncbi:MAG TPA: hypothetical protein VK034_10755, partial [Enhygromyxa sp.]|nr:hypothetical protein [Enhygromyxa sp.]